MQNQSVLTSPPSRSTSRGDSGSPSPSRPQSSRFTTEPKLRRACDNCNSRKVKCDSTGPPCQPCATYDLECTFERPTRRKGPVPRRLLASKRSKTVDRTSQQQQQHAPNSQLPSVATKAIESVPRSTLEAESICDLPILQTLVDDYFTYIHPIIPLPHEPSFRAALARRDDRVDRGFMALLAAMLEILVASFPRRPLQIFASEEARMRYPNAGALIDQCHRVFNEARGIGFNDREATLNDALCSYLAGLAAGYLFDMPRQRRYLSECVVILRTLGFHRSINPPPQEESQYSFTSSKTSIDHVYRQSGLRLFWLCFVGSMSVRQLGGYDADILMPPTSHSERLPLLPEEVDDEYIYSSAILGQPSGCVSKMAGFNLNVRLFRSFYNLTALETVFGADKLYHWRRQRQIIRHALSEVKGITKDAPKELQQVVSSDFDIFSSSTDDANVLTNASSFDGVNSGPKVKHYPSDQWLSEEQKLSKRAIQFEIQKANIYATQLATRSFLVEKFWNLYEIHEREQPSSSSRTHEKQFSVSSPLAECVASGLENRYQAMTGTPSDTQMDAGEQAMSVEREDIVRDMALLLRTINQVNMEPNGLSICNKIRQVASTLLNQDRSYMSSMPTLDTQIVSEYLHEFCNIITKLERLGPERIRAPGESSEFLTTQDVEEEALVQWASLKEHQKRFVHSQGFLATANV